MKKSKCKNKTTGLWNPSTTCTLETSLLVSFHRLSQELHFGLHPGKQKRMPFPLLRWNHREQVWDRPMSSQHLREPSFQIGLSLLVYRRETRRDCAPTPPPGSLPQASLTAGPFTSDQPGSPLFATIALCALGLRRKTMQSYLIIAKTEGRAESGQP